MTREMQAMVRERKGIVIIALGNRFRGDDGVGLEIAHRLRERVPGCTIVEGLEDAFALLNAWEDYPVAIVLDAAVSGSPPGTIHRIEAGDGPIPRDLARCSSHGVGLAEAVDLAKVLGRLPERLVVYAVEVSNLRPGSNLSAEVMVSAYKVADRLAQEIAQLQKT